MSHYTIIPSEVKELSEIPDELKARPQWVAWRIESRDGKPRKTPLSPKTGGHARVDESSTWGTFEQALNHYEAHRGNGVGGIGFVFTAGDPFTGVDLDKCRDLETGEIGHWAMDTITRLNSYAEISPSGCGVHVLLKGKLPEGPRRKGQVEMYDYGRFFTVTGLHLEGTPTGIEDRQVELEALHAQHFPQVGGAIQEQEERPESILSDEEVLSMANQSEKFESLLEGDWQGIGYASASEADLALCAILTRHSQDPKQIDRLFRQSGLMRPKWGERRGEKSYGQITIAKALSGQPQQGPIGSRYRPRPSLSNPKNAADLENDHLPEPTWNISGFLTTGLALLAGAPKVGKSWLVLAFALAIASGGLALGKLKTKQGRVCYISLEDTERRLKDRISRLWGDGFPPLLDIVLDMPRLDKGGIGELEKYLSKNPDCLLVVIDTLGRVKPRTRNPSYDADVDSLSQLQTLTQKFNDLTIVLVTHTRKLLSDDPFDMISGTLGLSGTADTNMVLKKQQRGGVAATLYITGRDVEEREINLKFDSGAWEITDKLPISPERQRIMELLRTHGPMAPKEIAEALNEKDNNIRKLLSSMQRDGQVQKTPLEFEGGKFIDLNKYQCQ